MSKGSRPRSVSHFTGTLSYESRKNPARRAFYIIGALSNNKKAPVLKRTRAIIPCYHLYSRITLLIRLFKYSIRPYAYIPSHGSYSSTITCARFRRSLLERTKKGPPFGTKLQDVFTNSSFAPLICRLLSVISLIATLSYHCFSY